MDICVDSAVNIGDLPNICDPIEDFYIEAFLPDGEKVVISKAVLLQLINGVTPDDVSCSEIAIDSAFIYFDNSIIFFCDDGEGMMFGEFRLFFNGIQLSFRG